MKWCVYFVVLLAIAALLTSCGGGLSIEEIAPNSVALVPDGEVQSLDFGGLDNFGDDIPISRGLVAKKIALVFSDRESINHAPRLISFDDTRPQLWFDRYINTAVGLGHLSGVGDFFHPEAPLTLEQAQIVLDRLDPGNSIQIQLTAENRHMAISYALWVNLFLQVLDNISGDRGFESHFGIKRENVVVLVTPEFNPALPNGHIITNRGHFAAVGFDFASHLDKEVAILHRNKEVLAILAITNNTPTLENVYIVEKTNSSITIFAGGVQRTYEFDTRGLASGRVADVRLNGRQAQDVEVFEGMVRGIVLEVTGQTVEIEDLGIFPKHPNFAVYSSLGPLVTLGGPEMLTIGYDVAEFILRDGQVAAAVVLRRPNPEHIRVVLSTTGFTGRIHQEVALRSESGFVLHTDEYPIQVAAGEVFRISAAQNAHLLRDGRLTAVPNNSGKIEIISISRAWPDGASPQYRGILEISRRGGGFVIVNQLPLEEYLAAVIPSEMPTSFGLEAAKVQAVTARSYAYNQFFANRFYMYGANVDDSVMSQVFNNFPETAVSVAAAEATRGIFLSFGGNIVSANFFSTSAGHTANSGDVWINGNTWEFDAPTPPYLSAQPQYLSGNFGDLSQEVNARAFFQRTDIPSFDDHSPWFRWNLELSAAQLTEIIAANLPTLAAANPHLFQMPDTATFPPQFVTDIGDFQSMEVISRGSGGNIRELLITGRTGSVLVRTEYAIRRLLTPRTHEGVVLHRHNASDVTNHFILPSTFMVFEAVEGGLRFYGGGFGHGVGMSQNGVFGMVQRGYNFEEILRHFYPGSELVRIGD